MTEHRTGVRRGRMLALAAVLLVLALAGWAPPTATAAPATATVAAGGLSDLNACVNARAKAGGDPTLRLAVVIDESRSLRDSDPDNARVTAAKALVDQLASQGEQQGFEIAGLVAGFSSSVDNSTGFQALTPATVGTFTSAIDAFAGRNEGQDTDYWSATSQIRTLFADARGAADPTDPTASPCQAVVLVTDGRFDLTTRDATKPYPGAEGVTIDDDAAKNRVIEAGVTDLCRAAGPVDALRADQITLIAVGLKGDQDAPDFSLLQRMATGRPSACGAQPPNGAFFQADDVSDLILILATIGSDSPAGETETTAICGPAQAKVCPSRSFDLSPAFTSAKLVVAIDADGIAVQLTSPDAKVGKAIAYTASAPKGMVEVNGVALNYQWYSSRALVIDMTGRASTSWNGSWKASFVDTAGTNGDAVAKTQFSVQPDLYVEADLAGDSKTGLRPGETAQFAFAVRNGLREVLKDLDSGLTVKAVVTLTPKAAGATPVTIDDDITTAERAAPYSWPVPDSLPAGPALLSVTTTVTYKQTTYAPTEREQQVKVLPPFTAPTPSGQVVFPRTEGTESVDGTLTVDAPQQGSGCVWVDGTTLVAAPAALTSVEVTSTASSESNCVQIAAGSGSQRLTLQLTPGAEANGDLTGTVDVHLKPQGSGTAVVTAVRFTGSVERTPQGLVFWLVLAGCILLGVLVPAAVYALIRRRGARFPTVPLHQVTCSAFVVGPQLEVGRDTNRQLLQIDSSRRSARGVEHTLTAVVGWKPTEAGHAQIARSGWVGVGEVAPFVRDGAAIVSVALAGSWAVFVPQGSGVATGERVEAQLFLVIPAAASDDYLQRLRERAAGEFHQRHAQLAAALTVRAPELVGVGGGAGARPASGWVDPSSGPTSGPGGWPSGGGAGAAGSSSPPAGPPPSPPSSWGSPAGPTPGAGGAPDPAPPARDPSRGWWDGPG